MKKITYIMEILTIIFLLIGSIYYINTEPIIAILFVYVAYNKASIMELEKENLRRE